MPFCPHAVIFDMDGLLVDSEPVWAIAEHAVLDSRGVVLDPTHRGDLVGLRMDEFWTRMASIYALTEPIDTLIVELVSRMQQMIPVQVLPRPGAVELLKDLKDRGAVIALASSSPIAIIQTVVDSKGWNGYFAECVSGDEVARGKPAPDVFLETARRLGVDPHAALVLEDSVNGARAAVAAGMTCYAVPDPSHVKPEQFAEITPYVFDSLHDVIAALEHCEF